MSDVLNVLCATDIMYPMFFGTEQNVKGINLSGMYKILSHIITFTGYGEDCIITFDSKTDRHKFVPTYKKGRKHIPEIELQCKLLEMICPKLGIQTLKIDNMESDDLVYSLCYNERSNYRRINIFSCDRDLSHNIDSQNVVSMISVNTTQPSINKINYEFTLNKGKIIRYNTILAHKFFFGDESDKIPPLHIEDCNVTTEELFYHFIHYSGENGYSDEQLSDIDAITDWISFMIQCFQDDVIEYMSNRVECIYPRYSKKCVVNKSKLNTSYLAKVLTSFGWFDLLNLARLKSDHSMDDLVSNMLNMHEELVNVIKVSNSQSNEEELDNDTLKSETELRESNSFGWEKDIED